jgi:hypothetical protein
MAFLCIILAVCEKIQEKQTFHLEENNAESNHYNSIYHRISIHSILFDANKDKVQNKQSK